MLKDFVKAIEPEEEELRKELKEAQAKLAGFQTQIKEAKLPVMVIFEGWGAAGKGSVIGRVIKSIDPRFFRVKTMKAPTEEELRYPFLHRYLLEIPEAGKFAFFDTYLSGDEILLPYQQEGAEKASGRADGRQEHALESQSRRSAREQALQRQVLRFLNQGIETALKNHSLAAPIRQNIFPLNPIPKLADVDLSDKTLTKEEYDSELDRLQKELSSLHNELYRKRIPVIIAYEGWDAAGKGGNIKRITSALDPRGYEVHPIASPEPHEKARHFLWRFWTRLPKDGHIAIFDRTWYGRVMVERLEGFCSENDWQRAYNEMNEFEKELADWGAVVIKFWVQIDNQTQLERFTDRQNTPEKQWKITDEDWRNREKWNDYEAAIDEMLQKTNTAYAPWYILESNDKKYARIKALKIVVDSLKKACKEKKDQE